MYLDVRRSVRGSIWSWSDSVQSWCWSVSSLARHERSQRSQMSTKRIDSQAYANRSGQRVSATRSGMCSVKLRVFETLEQCVAPQSRRLRIQPRSMSGRAIDSARGPLGPIPKSSELQRSGLLPSPLGMLLGQPIRSLACEPICLEGRKGGRDPSHSFRLLAAPPRQW